MSGSFDLLSGHRGGTRPGLGAAPAAESKENLFQLLQEAFPVLGSDIGETMKLWYLAKNPPAVLPANLLPAIQM